MTGTFQTLPRQYRCSTFSYLPGSRHLDNRHQKISDGVVDGRNGISDGRNGISDGRNEISDGRNGISDGRNGISDGRNGISDGRNGISDGRNGISDGSDENSEPSYVNLNYDRRPFPQKNFKQGSKKKKS